MSDPMTRRTALAAALSVPALAACGQTAPAARAAPAQRPAAAASAAPAPAPAARPTVERPASPSARAVVITVLGDSLTTGYGLPSSQALPAQLERELAALGVKATVRGAAVNGDTTSGGLRRVDTGVRADTDLCVVALGGNDLLTFADPGLVRSNVEAIVRRLKARGIRVVLAGMQAPAELGGYARAFNGIFPSVAREQGVPLYPSLLAGVMLDRRYNQEDLVHPNAAGVNIIARRLAPTVAAALRSKGAAAA